MKKRFYTACAFAVLALTAAAATSTPRTVTTHRNANTLRTVTTQEIEAQANEMVVPISILCNNGSGQTSQYKAEYDQKGRVCRITLSDGTVYQVTYVENAEGVWATKNTSVRKGGEELHRLKTERTFDDKGRVTNIEEASYNFDSKQWTPTHSYAYDYDMSHLDKDLESISDGDAILIKDITYEVTSTGIPYSKGFECVWFEPDQEYTYLELRLGFKEEIQLDGNTYWYSNAYYDETTGEITSARYIKKEVQEDTPLPGYYTITSYESDDNKNWKIEEKDEFTTNFYAPFTPDDKQQRERTRYYYDKDSQQFRFSSKWVYEWVDHPTLKLVKNTFSETPTGPGSQSYELVDEQGRTYGYENNNIVLSDNGDYSFNRVGNGVVLLTFYSAQGEKKRQVRITDTQSTLAQAPYIAEELKDGEWVPLKNADLKNGDTGLMTTSFKTNENGYITSLTYNYINELNLECTYSDTGYTSELSKKFIDGSAKKPLRKTDVCTKTSEDAFEIVSTEYAGDGTVASKVRKVCRDGVIYVYEWDSKINQWSDKCYTSVAPETTVEEDGTQTTIDRTYSDGKVVNSTKVVLTTYRIPNIKMKLPANPMPEVIPAEFFSDIYHPLADSGLNMTNYEWNTETNQWDVTSDYPNNGYSVTKDATTGDIIHHVKIRGDYYTYRVDSEGRLTSYQDPDHHFAYTYDEDGNLRQIQGGNGTDKESIYFITYGKMGITDGIGLPTATQALQLHVDGRTVTLADASSHALGSKSLQLYSLDGKLVGKSQTGSVTAPAAGTYVVVADGVKAKISVK